MITEMRWNWDLEMEGERRVWVDGIILDLRLSMDGVMLGPL
jgi:hypothetical protein